MLHIRALACIFFACLGCASNCPDVPAPADCDAGAPSFSTEISPIYQKTCDLCHTGDGIGEPVDYSTYDNIRANAGRALGQLVQCRMPLPDGGVTLAESDREKMIRWLKCGAPNN